MKNATSSGVKRNDEQGAALVVAILALMLVSAVAIAIIDSAMIARQVAINSREQSEAYHISEAGLTHALNLVTKAGAGQFTNILRAGDGVAGTGDELSTQPSGRTPIPGVGIAFGSGTYVVRITDDSADTDGNPNADSNGRLVITSVGRGMNEATATTEAVVAVSGMPAILVNGPLRINGNPIIRGTQGSVHANGRLEITGGPCADVGFNSSSTVVRGGARGAGCSGVAATQNNQPIIEPPTYNFRLDFLPNADYYLGAIGTRAGKVYNGAGTLIFDATGTGEWSSAGSQWSWDPGSARWVHGGGTILPGTYYTDGNIEVGDSFGTPASPARVSLVAEGYISISGNPYMTPDYLNFSMMAGTDLRVSGNPAAGANNYQGIHFAEHQIGFSGNPAINGVIIAANRFDSNSPVCGCNLIPRQGDGSIEISGNPTVTNNGGLGDRLRVLSWREVRF